MVNTAKPIEGRNWAADPVTERMGIRRQDTSDGGILTILDAVDEHCNVFGVVHGAVLYAMADVAMGSMLTKALGEFRPVSTVSIISNYLRPTKRGRIRAETELIRLGRSIATLETKTYDNDGILCALFLGTFHISLAKDAAT
ncbi:MAG: PaaI family thioesterase [Hyphomicrobiales bacterium]|nr:PaaI family thioesterase [Hyphomicrobiales bacterium]MCP5073536.1 PaaI family thioesterase [Paracoccaceae bacterium]